MLTFVAAVSGGMIVAAVVVGVVRERRQARATVS
jgi:hypothetical protein